MFLLSLSIGYSAWADEVSCSSDSTAVNCGLTINGDDTATINANITLGSSDAALYLNSNNNTINNTHIRFNQYQNFEKNFFRLKLASHDHTTVNCKNLTSNVASIFRSEKCANGCDVLGFTHTLHRNHTDDRFLCLFV